MKKDHRTLYSFKRGDRIQISQYSCLTLKTCYETCYDPKDVLNKTDITVPDTLPNAPIVDKTHGRGPLELALRTNYRRENVLALSEQYLSFIDDQPTVFVKVAPQNFESRPIQVGLSNGLLIEILGGLNEHDRIRIPAISALQPENA